MRKALIAAAALLATTVAANATVVTGTYTALSSQSSTHIGDLLSTNFSLNLVLGEAQTINFLSLRSVVAGVADIDAAFNFSIPASGSTDLHGIDTFSTLGILSFDHLAWDNGGVKQVTLADGTLLAIGLSDLNFIGLIYTGLVESVTFTLLQGPTLPPPPPPPPHSVPEPLTLSLFGAGLAGIAAIGRRRRKISQA